MTPAGADAAIQIGLDRAGLVLWTRFPSHESAQLARSIAALES